MVPVTTCNSHAATDGGRVAVRPASYPSAATLARSPSDTCWFTTDYITAIYLHPYNRTCCFEHEAEEQPGPVSLLRQLTTTSWEHTQFHSVAPTVNTTSEGTRCMVSLNCRIPTHLNSSTVLGPPSTDPPAAHGWGAWCHRQPIRRHFTCPLLL